MKTKVYLEIGYSNIKSITNTSKNIDICIANKTNLKKILDYYLKQKNDIFVLSNNEQLNKLFLQFKKYKNIFLFNIKNYQSQFLIPKKFNLNELGNDLIFLIHYLQSLPHENIILVSNGSCIVTIIKKDGNIDSISINSGIFANKKILENYYNLKSNFIFYDKSASNTNDSICLGYYLMINGIINESSKFINSVDLNYVFCGNGFDTKYKNYLLSKYNPINIDNNLVLKLFEQWCLNNL